MVTGLLNLQQQKLDTEFRRYSSRLWPYHLQQQKLDTEFRRKEIVVAPDISTTVEIRYGVQTTIALYTKWKSTTVEIRYGVQTAEEAKSSAPIYNSRNQIRSLDEVAIDAMIVSTTVEMHYSQASGHKFS